MKPVILLGEDDRFFQALLKKSLTEANFDVIAANNGIEVLELAKRDQPDLILLDLIMPEKDGFETLSDLQQDPQLQQIPVVVLSSLEQPEDMQRVLTLGAKAHLSKLDTLAIVAQVKAILTKPSTDVSR